jgi:hypothetical protein
MQPSTQQGNIPSRASTKPAYRRQELILSLEDSDIIPLLREIVEVGGRGIETSYAGISGLREDVSRLKNIVEIRSLEMIQVLKENSPVPLLKELVAGQRSLIEEQKLLRHDQSALKQSLDQLSMVVKR